MPLTFPKPNEPIPPTDVSPRTLILYGPPKIGKTTVITSLPDYLLVELEPNGAKYVSAVKIELDNILQIAQVEDHFKKSNPKPTFRFLVVDTLDQLEVWAELEATRRYKASTIGSTFKGDSVLELPKGGGYFHLRNTFYEYFNRLRSLAPYTIFLGHVKDGLLGVEGKEVASKDLDLTGKVKNIVCSYADATGHAFRAKDGKFTVNFKTTDIANCGSRCAHLAGKEFVFDQPATVENWKQLYPNL